MKAMTCKQFGGACDKEFHASTFEEMAELSKKHGMEMYQSGDEKHLKAMKEDLGKRADWYNENFGILPAFKAGFHYGEVTTGEIGALKKEIIFTGDVLNSTARIQGLCNQYNVDLLISDELMKSLDHDSEFQFKSLGKNELRGKMENIELYTIV